MRSRNSLILVGVVTALAVSVLVLGCSDDDTPTTTTPVEEDHGIESMLDIVSAQVNQYLDSAVTAMESGLRVATFADIGGDDIGDAFMGAIHPDSTNGDNDWIIAWVTDLQAGLGTMTIVDSLTYVVGGELGVSANGADAMYVKHNYSYQAADTTVSFNNVAHRGFVHITGIDGMTATVNGDFRTVVNDKFVSSDSTVWNDWVIEADLCDLQMVRTGDCWTTGCPNSGTASVTVQYTYARDLDIPTTTIWDYQVAFSDGEIDVDVTIGNLSTSYEYTLCTP